MIVARWRPRLARTLEAIASEAAQSATPAEPPKPTGLRCGRSPTIGRAGDCGRRKKTRKPGGWLPRLCFVALWGGRDVEIEGASDQDGRSNVKIQSAQVAAQDAGSALLGDEARIQIADRRQVTTGDDS